MTQKNMLLAMGLMLVLAIGAYLFLGTSPRGAIPTDPRQVPQAMTLSGSYVCLPHMNTAGPQTDECAFGLKADDGTYYAVNFGQSATAMQQFQSGAHITAEGFVVLKAGLDPAQWDKYDMKGMFTVTRVIDPAPAQGRIDIGAVCQGALAYMTFTDATSADAFVAECKDGKHPEVIERFRAQMGAGDGATI